MRPVMRSGFILGLVLIVYYALPAARLPSTASAVVSIAGLVVGVPLLAWRIALQVRRQVRSGTDDSVRTETLLVLLYLSVLLFALGYYVLASSTDGQFSGLETRTDALYFTVTTLATVGFGDIHAAGQAARALVTAQIVFNLVFIGALVSLLTGRLRRRATEH